MTMCVRQKERLKKERSGGDIYGGTSDEGGCNDFGEIGWSWAVKEDTMNVDHEISDGGKGVLMNLDDDT